MKVKITNRTGAFPDSEGRLIAPSVGDEVEVESKTGKALIAAELAEAAGVVAKARAAAAPKRRRVEPKENTVGKKPDEVR